MTQNSANGRIYSSRFKPAWWLRNRHAQTIFSALPWSGTPQVTLESEALELPDGDVTFVDWEGERPITVRWRQREPLAERLSVLFGVG